MFQQIILSAIRSIIIAGGSAYAAKGAFLSSNDVEVLAGAVVTLAAGVWGAWDKVRTEKKTQARESVAAVEAATQVAAELNVSKRVEVWTEEQRAGVTGGG